MRAGDYVVAGGGTAGAIVARRLADAGAEVILIEAGPTGEHDQRATVLSRHQQMMMSELDYGYRIEPGGGRGNPMMPYPQARILGGCSTHNACITFRAPDWDLERWERGGLAGWGPSGCAPYFDRVFDRVNVESSPGGHPWVQGFLEAGQAIGLPLVDFGEPNIRSGVGLLRQNRRGALRESSAAAYLFPLAELPPNLRVVTEETVTSVILDDRGEAVGVDTTRGRIFARQEVILCGGSFGSPKTLLLSGIGPADELREVGVEPVVDLPGVGKHLVDHPEAQLLFEATEAVTDVLMHTSWESALFACLEDGEEDPEVMVHFDTAGFDMFALMAGYPKGEVIMALHPNVTRPHSEGSVRLRSADPSAQLVINTGLFTDPDGYDERVLIEGIRIARNVAAQPALAKYIKRELAPGADVVDSEALSVFGRTTGGTVLHPSGTCKLGSDGDPLAVVDGELRVRGVGRLRVADASVLPSLVSVNPNITVMMIGERCAAAVLGEAGAASVAEPLKEAVA